MPQAIRTTAIFLKPFVMASFNETLPAGEYEIESEFLDPIGGIDPGNWTSFVMVRLHPQDRHPGLSRTLTVPLMDLERALAKDKLTGMALADFFLGEILADPLMRRLMKTGELAEDELRSFYANRS